MAHSIGRPALWASCALLSACAAGMPADALRLSPDAPANRELQSRRYAGVAEDRVLAAAASQLQDLGFAIDASETQLGLVVASKDRTAVNDAERTTAYLMAVLSILAMAPSEPVYAHRQLLRVALVTQPLPGDSPGEAGVMVRVTFQRSVFDNQGHLYSLAAVNDPTIYQEFFERLSQSIFLERHTP